MNATCKAVGLVCALTAAAACGGEAPKTVLERLVCHDLPVSQCAAAAIMGERQQNINILVQLAGCEGQGRRYMGSAPDIVPPWYGFWRRGWCRGRNSGGGGDRCGERLVGSPPLALDGPGGSGGRSPPETSLPCLKKEKQERAHNG